MGEATQPVTDPMPPSGDEFDYLRPGPARDTAMAQHPLTLDEQLFQTGAVHAAYDALRKAIRFRKWGLSFFCSPRWGKTWTIDALVAMLAIDFPDIPVFVTEALQHDDPTEKSLWTDILVSLEHLAGQTAQAQRATLLDLIVSSAALHGNAKFAVLFVDEAQNWGARQWRFIKGLVNSLRNRPYRIRVLVVSFGQTDLLRVKEEISKLNDKGEDLLARFLRNMHEFHGVANVAELTEVLKQLDDPQLAEYPEDSGVCYARFFMPLAYAAGWRLAVEASHIWKALHPAGKRSRKIKMLYVMDILREFFLLAEDASNFKASLPLWKRAFQGISYGEDD